ncbi:MAG: serine/threonine-protein kinase [Gemmatimonadota bacterium]
MGAMDPGRWQRVEELFLTLLETPPQQRLGLMQELCGDDRPLYESVESLLEGHLRSEGFLETPLAQMERGSGPESKHIGPYRIVKPLARGGMGSVFLAVQEGEGFRRSVAVKVVRTGMDSPEALARFRQERGILASLKHPNIARFLDGGVSAEDVSYVAMEYVEGDPVDRYCQTHRLSVPERIALFLKVCDAVHHAHGNLVLHRDLKPGNILVTPDGHPKLLDFGIAKLLDPSQPPEPLALTQGDRPPFTPEYAAPEQLRGEAVSVATDVYSLGVVLHELLWGYRPRDPATSGSRTVGTARSLSTRSSGDLKFIVDRAVSTNPMDRYSSVDALRDDLVRYQQGRPVRARPSTSLYRARRFVGRNRAGVAAAATVALVVLGAVGVLIYQGRQAALERDRALEVRGFLLEMFGAAAPDRTAVDSVTAVQLLDRQAQSLETLYGNRPDLRAEMMMALAEGYDRLGMWKSAAELAENALKVRREFRGETDSRSAVSLGLLGWIRHEQGSSEEGEDLLRQALSDLGSGREWDRERSRILNDLGVVLEAQGEYDEAEEHYTRALELRRRVFGLGHRSVAITGSNLSVIRYRRGDLSGAVEAASQALAVMQEAVGPDHQRSIIIAHNLAAMQMALGDMMGAEAEYRELLDRQTRLQGAEHPTTVNIQVALARALLNQGKWEEAGRHYGTAIPLLEARLGPRHPMLGQSLLGLGEAELEGGRAEDAHPHLARAHEILQQALEEGHPDRVQAARLLEEVVGREER